MNVRDFKNLKDISNLFLNLIVPNIGRLHLDYGCGNGVSSFMEAILCPNALIVGYDNDLGKIKIAEKKLGLTNLTNLVFKNSLNEWKSCPAFNSATVNFVFHENQLNDILPTLKVFC
jgi:16S rRNA G1207 methylase RsmC